MHLDDLWPHRDNPTVRDQLIQQGIPLVRYVAARMRATMPTHADFDDLVSLGSFGLIEAVDRFDPDLGFRFSTYAVKRIRGSILDGLREMDWAPRAVRREWRSLERAMETINERSSEHPSLQELADELDIPEDDVARILNDRSTSMIGSLDEVTATDDDETTTLGDMQPGTFDDLEQVAMMSESRDMIADALPRLGANHRTLLALYYFEGLTLTQIGVVLGVTESRVCQMHASAMKELRTSVVA